jgi:hypothetical protein
MRLERSPRKTTTFSPCPSARAAGSSSRTLTAKLQHYKKSKLICRDQHRASPAPAPPHLIPAPQNITPTCNTGGKSYQHFLSTPPHKSFAT